MISSVLIGGITLGVIYALIALGYSLVYGILKFINFAHGDIYMIGAFTGLYIGTNYTASPWVLIPVAAVTTGLLGFVVEKVAYKPLRSAPRLNSMITAIAVGTIFEGIILKEAGPQTQGFPQVFSNHSINLGVFNLTSIQVWLLIIVAVLLLVLFWIVMKTDLGISMRAASENISQLNLLGVSSDRVISLTFILGSALGGVAGVLAGAYFTAIFPYMGVTGGIKAFVAAIIGGIGSLPGAVVGGLIMGVSEVLTATVFKPSYRDAIAFVLLIVILLYRPQGLFGDKGEERF